MDGVEHSAENRHARFLVKVAAIELALGDADARVSQGNVAAEFVQLEVMSTLPMFDQTIGPHGEVMLGRLAATGDD